jgi:two-component system sensor histidine kinase BaeS
VRRIATRLALAMAGTAVLTAVVALPVTIAYFERRLPPGTSAAVERDLRGGELDGAVELVVLAGATASVGALVGLVAAQRLARPLTALSAAAQQVARGELGARPDVAPKVRHGRDELAGLLRDFTSMAESLERSDSERRATAAGLAHELRTPLTVLQARLEAARDGILVVDGQEVAILLDQTQLLARLVDDLRTLSLAEAGKLTLHRREIDLSALTAAVVAGFGVLADEAGVRLVGPQRDTPVPLTADADRVGQAIANLITNGVRHAGPGGRVTVTVTADSTTVTLRVHDTGPGFPADLLPHAFDQFTRAARSANAEAGGDGSGLGLAVVLAVAGLHGGTAEATNPTDGGASVELRLPRRPPAST